MLVNEHDQATSCTGDDMVTINTNDINDTTMGIPPYIPPYTTMPMSVPANFLVLNTPMLVNVPLDVSVSTPAPLQKLSMSQLFQLEGSLKHTADEKI